MSTETTEKKTTPRKPAASKQPKIYESLAAILKSLSVAKGGQLPGNMGGKPYITAADLAAEAKRQFVENNIVFVPNEEVTKHEVIGGPSDRKTVIVGIRGEYTLIHVEDGSSLTISGVGDGLATGTAVASNIASTNAQKNALLRTFMVTEQSVEDAAKNGEGEPGGGKQSAASRKVSAAKQPARPAAAEGPDYREMIRTEIIENDQDSRTADEVNELNKKLKSENPKSGLKELYEALKNGEVA